MPSPRAHASRLAPYLALAACAAVAFTGLLSVGLVWDDPYVTVGNPHLASWRGVWTLATSDVWSGTSVEEISKFYRPLPMLAYALDRALLGNTPLAYHASSWLVHLASTWLVYSLARRRDSSSRGAAALFAAALFAVAPLGVEAVTWIGCRFDLLGVMLTLASLRLVGARGRGAPVASGALVGAALFCKETFVVAPALVLAWEAWIERRRPSIARYAAVAAVFAAYVALRRAAGVAGASTVAHLGVGDVVRSYAFSLETFTRALVWPTVLDPSRPYAPRGLAASAALALTAWLAWAALAGTAWRRGWGDRGRGLVFGVGWYLFALGPASAAGPTLGMIGDRYAYFAIVGWVFALAAALSACPWRAVASVASAAALVASTARCRARVPEFADDHTLFSAAARDDPDNAFAWYMLGQAAAVAGRLDEADALLARSAALAPGSWRTDNALCYVRLNQGRLDEALSLCHASAASRPSNPRVWTNLAAIHLRAGRHAACVGATDRGLGVKPHDVEARYLRATCLANLGRYEEASDELARCLSLSPAHAGALNLAAQFRAAGVRAP
ncbi:MAG: tetratricopeptide repeat protein [Polyangiaceae bacterium]|nr:tetratricopeptide repeat protein [Polyangiaceae bacterium]